MINNTNESKSSEDKKEALINHLLAINLLLKFIQAVILYMNTYEQEMITVGDENGKIKNKDRWKYSHHMHMLPLLGANHRLQLLHMNTRFIWIE